MDGRDTTLQHHRSISFDIVVRHPVSVLQETAGQAEISSQSSALCAPLICVFIRQESNEKR